LVLNIAANCNIALWIYELHGIALAAARRLYGEEELNVKKMDYEIL